MAGLEEGEQETGRFGQVDLEFGEIVQANGQDDVVGLVLARDPFVSEPLLARRPAGQGNVQNLRREVGPLKTPLEKLRKRLARFEAMPISDAVAEDDDGLSSSVGCRRVKRVNDDGWHQRIESEEKLLVVGSFLEPPAAILVLTPLFLPVVQALGVDPIHFGIIMTANLAIGMFTPPFGLNLFATHALFGVPLPTLYRGVLPFLGLYLIALMLITYVPWLTTGLLTMLGK